MQTNLDRITLTIFAALGLPLGCAVGPGTIDTESETSGDGDPSGDGDGDPSGDGDGDPSGDGDGDGDPSGDGDGDTGNEPHTCDNPEPILQTGTDTPTGFVRCEDGFVHRVEAVECLEPQGTDSPLCADVPGICGLEGCNDKPYGSCQDGGFEGCSCKYGCSTDADCDADYVCACAGVVDDIATCIPANCITDESCNGGLCGLSKYEGCCGNAYQVACASPDEECHINADCGEDLCEEGWPEGGMVMHQCSYDGSGWTCRAPGWCGCDCGRPFFVDGEAVIAPAIARADWSVALAPSLPEAAIRRELAAYWTEVGQFEHASIASFARFALQLLSLGAPPRLLADTRAALADEIEHARLAFGLASAYAAAPIGPGALPVETCLDKNDQRAILEGLIIEACVGETLAAIEAQEAALQAGDRAVAKVLGQIAQDELRHAQLGWRALAWMLDHAEASLRRFALRTLDQAITIVAGETPRLGRTPALREHGVLDDELRASVRAAAIAAVIRPAAAALEQRFATREQSVACS